MHEWTRPPDLVVAGSPRSGTTLLQRLVVEACGAGTGPETHFWNLFVPRHQHLVTARLTEPRWRALLQIWLAMPEQLGLRASPAFRHALPLLRGPLEATELWGLVSRATRTHCDGPHIEKTPGHAEVLGLLLDTLPGLRAIGVLRDPIANVSSNRRVPFGMTDPTLLLHRWRRDAETLVTAAATHPERVLLVRLEEATANPERTRAKIREFTELSGAGADGLLQLPSESWKQRATSGPIEERDVDTSVRPRATSRTVELAARLGYYLPDADPPRPDDRIRSGWYDFERRRRRRAAQVGLA